VSLVTSAEEAEEVIKQWLNRKFSDKLRDTRVREIHLAENIWNVKAEVVLRSGTFSTSNHVLQMQVDAVTGKIIGYSESGQSQQKP